MKILMIAPEPFFQPRGTPFSEYYRIKCLTELGHEVDLVTYPIGDDVELPGLRIIRAPRIFGIKNIAIGPSLQKIPLDISLFFAAWRQVARGGYDAIHTHEEAGIMGVFLARFYGLPHVYDMHSSLPQQFSNFQVANHVIIRVLFGWMEGVMIREAESTITICQSLYDTAREIDPEGHITLIENVAESHDVDAVSAEEVEQLRDNLGLRGKRIILYTGTFEAYQGLDLLLAACARLFPRHPDTVLLMVGGRPEQVADVRRQAGDLGIADRCRFTGMVPHAHIPAYLKTADLLVSPRSTGTNTPLKIYAYLRSGRPIVATNLYTHTQVIRPDAAMLVDPDPEAFAAGMAAVLENEELGKRLAASAFTLSEECYSYDRYVALTSAVCERLEAHARTH